jgi:DNA-binding response OmpR family regulator
MDALCDKKILIIDDDQRLHELAPHIFANTHAQLFLAADGRKGLRLFFEQRPDLVILDLMLPGLDGWEVCATIRRLTNVPIIMLTALSREEDMVRGLESGAVDFITKPVSPKLLLARVRAALRQASSAPHPEKALLYQDEHLTIDLPAHRVLVEGRPVKLSATEFKLLAYFYQHAGQVLTFEQILTNIWGQLYRANAGYVHSYIWSLRQKLEPNPHQPIYLLTEHGVGYCFERQGGRVVRSYPPRRMSPKES